MLEGTYIPNDESYECDTVFYDNIELGNNDITLCEKTKYDIEDFAKETRSLITNANLLKKLKGKKN